MKRLLNFRMPLLLAAALSAGIALCYIFTRNKISAFWIIAAVPVAAAIFIFFTVKAKSFTPITAFILTVLFFVCGFGLCALKISLYDKNETPDSGVYSFSASVYEKGENSRGEYLIIKDMRADGGRVSGKAIIYLPETYGDYCETGYKITFSAKVTKYDTYTYGKLNYNAQNNVKYCLTLFGNIKADRGFSLFGSIRNSVRAALFDNLDKETAAISYAMLTGNAQAVEESAMQSFRYGGIAHVFAVSGLHIGILFGVLSFILKRLKLNKFISAPLCIFPVFFYAGVCGFTLSSVRAAIMCAVTVVARLFHKKYDGLNALSLSVVIILVIFPLSLFAVGFQLSVCAVLGILLLSKNVAKVLGKMKIPKKINLAAGVSFGAQAGTMPVMLASFGYISGAGLILNIVIIPLLSVIFQLTFAATLISVTFTFSAPYLIPVAALPLKAVISFLIDAGFEKALVSGFGAGAFTALYFLLLLFMSDKLNLKLLQKITAAGCAALVLITYTLVCAFSPSDGYKIIVSAYYNGGQTLIKHGGQSVLIVTQNLNTGQLKQFLSANYSAKPDSVIIIGGEDCATFYGELGIDCGEIYVFGEYAPVQPYGNVKVIYEKRFTAIGADFEFISGESVKVNCDGVTVGICANGETINGCDLCVGEAENSDGKTMIYYNAQGTEYSVYERGNIQVKIKDGKYTFK